MAVNDLTVTQASTILNGIMEQATGRGALAALDGSNFATVAQMALKTGYDVVTGAISQMVGRTIFTERTYVGNFRGLEASEQRFGNIARKLNISDPDFIDNSEWKLDDGQSVDMYEVHKPNILQTNFYGAVSYCLPMTTYKNQLDIAFLNPANLVEFMSMRMRNANNVNAQAFENLARATLVNLVSGSIASNNSYQVIHLLTEYNTKTGLSLSAEDIYKPENIKAFVLWLSARVETALDAIKDRTIIYHVNVTDKPISRFTSRDNARLYMLSEFKNMVDRAGLADVYNEKMAAIGVNEKINFWQSAQNPSKINFKPIYLKNDGTLTQPETARTDANIIGCIFDRDAAGVTVRNQWTGSTPLNARGGYWNTYFHWTGQYWNDFTENCIILQLD